MGAVVSVRTHPYDVAVRPMCVRKIGYIIPFRFWPLCVWGVEMCTDAYTHSTNPTVAHHTPRSSSCLFAGASTCTRRSPAPSATSNGRGKSHCIAHAPPRSPHSDARVNGICLSFCCRATFRLVLPIDTLSIPSHTIVELTNQSPFATTAVVPFVHATVVDDSMRTRQS